MASPKVKAQSSSGNVFADLGLEDAEDLNEKVRLAVALTNAMRASSLTQAELAERLGISQPKVSALLNFKLQGFSLEKLLALLRRFGHNVNIVVHAIDASAARNRGNHPAKRLRLRREDYRRALHLPENFESRSLMRLRA